MSPPVIASPIRIVDVDPASNFANFIKLPREIYAGMAGFEPPLDWERHEFLHPSKSPFFAHGRAAFFLALREGRPAGRICAHVDPLAIDSWGAPIGCFGCLDAIDDIDVIAALIGAARDWLRSQGMALMRGPLTYSVNGEVGLQISGQERGAMLLMPWHPAYLGERLAELGHAAAKDVVSYTVDLQTFALDDASRRLLDPAGLAGKLKVRPIDPRHIAQEAQIIRTLYNDAWRDNWGFVPVTLAEMETLTKQMKPILYREGFIIVEDAHGNPLAVALILPNASELARGLDGRLGPLKILRLASRIYRRRFAGARLLLFGIRHDLRRSPLGIILPTVIFAELIKRRDEIIGKYAFSEIELGWILEDNTAMRRLIERFGLKPTKRHRIYDIAIQ